MYDTKRHSTAQHNTTQKHTTQHNTEHNTTQTRFFTAGDPMVGFTSTADELLP